MPMDKHSIVVASARVTLDVVDARSLGISLRRKSSQQGDEIVKGGQHVEQLPVRACFAYPVIAGHHVAWNKHSDSL